MDGAIKIANEERQNAGSWAGSEGSPGAQSSGGRVAFFAPHVDVEIQVLYTGVAVLLVLSEQGC